MTESNKNIFVLDNDNKNNSNSTEKWQQYLQRMLLVTAS